MAVLGDNLYVAYQISFDYSYLDKAAEIWTIKDDKVYIIDYVANEQFMI